MTTTTNEITDPSTVERMSASRTAESAHEAAVARNHIRAEELYLLAAAKASALGSVHMLKLARQWDRDAARQQRLAKIAGAKP